MFGICHTFNRDKQLISQRSTTSNGTTFFSFVYVTNKAMHYGREFLQGIRRIMFRRLIMMASCPFFCVKCFDFFCVAPDHALMLKNCLKN